MIRLSNEDSAARRAHWLAELADALDEARRLINQLGAADGQIDAVELYARIEAVRLEVQAIRLRKSRATAEDFNPEWSKDFPWRCSA